MASEVFSAERRLWPQGVCRCAPCGRRPSPAPRATARPARRPHTPANIPVFRRSSELVISGPGLQRTEDAAAAPHGVFEFLVHGDYKVIRISFIALACCMRMRRSRPLCE